LDGQEPPVGCEADLRQCGQVSQPLADAEVAGLIDGCLGTDGLSELVVLLDPGVLVVDVQARGDPAGDRAPARSMIIRVPGVLLLVSGVGLAGCW
jgi:hypothetical protein